MNIFKKVYNIDELNAIKTQYEEPVKSKEVVSLALVPAIYLFCFTYFLFYYFWFSVLSGLIGAVYGVIVILPRVIKRNHYKRSQRERNRLLNSLTQNLVNDKITTADGLQTVSSRISGELSKDLELLVTELKYGDDQDKINAYEVLIEKYRKDRIFVQYIDQLQTATLEGRNNISELDDLATYHDLVIVKQDIFFENKNEKLSFYTLASILSLVIAIVISKSTWDYGYHQYFAKGIIGWVVGGLYILLNVWYSNKFIKDYFDDEVMEVRK